MTSEASEFIAQCDGDTELQRLRIREVQRLRTQLAEMERLARMNGALYRSAETDAKQLAEENGRLATEIGLVVEENARLRCRLEELGEIA